MCTRCVNTFEPNKKSKSKDLLFYIWDNRTRTYNERVKVSCVAVTPYPNIICDCDILSQSHRLCQSFFSEKTRGKLHRNAVASIRIVKTNTMAPTVEKNGGNFV